MPFDQSDFSSPAVAAPILPVLSPVPATDAVLKCLVDAREWLSDPAHWTQNSFGDSGVSRCSWGALMDADRAACRVLRVDCGHATSSKALHILDRLCFIAGRVSTVKFNDDPRTTHADVLALFDRAIAARTQEVSHA